MGQDITIHWGQDITNCLVSWDKIQRPLNYGILGILNLEILGWALKLTWLWAQKTRRPRPWDNFQVEVPRNAKALFSMAVISIIGTGGKKIVFWKDRCLDGKNIAELAPHLFKIIAKKTVNKRTVVEAMSNQRWVSDIKGALPTCVSWWLGIHKQAKDGCLGDQQLQSELQRKAMARLMGLQFQIVYKKGKENLVADALSRVGTMMELAAVSEVQPIWVQEVGYKRIAPSRCLSPL